MKIGVILGSIRDIRRGGRVAKWLMPQLSKFKAVEIELLDLKDYPLPFFNESNSPEGLKGEYTNTVAKKWSAKIASMDGFIFITPEYNHGTSAVLKNALDWLYYEWVRKPVAFISYSPNAAGGVRAVEQLRQNVIELQMAPLREAIHITYVLDTLDEQGNLLKGHFDERLVKLMEELLWWANALKTARNEALNT
ncbi:NAD(P)H-dependent oxidoreductase [Candidatus Daviesbacteria bacterium]|nr:NAD(P)H-dependent oxidoreductase [Candidatus Daviesbacteria bacterium]